MFKVSITSRAERELKRLDRPVKNRIIVSLSALASDPRPPGCLKVKSEHKRDCPWMRGQTDFRYSFSARSAATAPNRSRS